MKQFLILGFVLLSLVYSTSSYGESSGIDSSLFWQSANIQNTVVSHDKIEMEHNFINFAEKFHNCSDTLLIHKEIKYLTDAVATDSIAFSIVKNLVFKHLSSLDSPLADDELLIPFLNFFITSPFINEAENARYNFLIEAATKNRKGTPATDFTFITRENEESSLYSLEATENSRILLIFYDPDCEKCKETIKELKVNEDINRQISQSSLTVMAIYSGEEEENWRRNSGQIPVNWVDGYDRGEIDNNDLYFFKTTPTIYLLDGNKKILAKDLTLSELLKAI